jgi:D-arabinose 1-dehydrogenase-like Zn-dependent alcohol dehydrogenase
MTSQTALALVEIAKPLALIQLPIPEPAENQILIKPTVAGRKSYL